MNTPLPYTTADLTRLVARAKYNIEQCEPDLIAVMCRDLLPWAGRVEVDRTLGQLLKLLMRHGSTAKVAEIEAAAFPLDRLSHGWNPQDASVAYVDWKYRQAFQPERDPDLAQAKALTAAAEALWPHLDEPTRLAHGLYLKLATVHGTLGDVQSLRKLGEGLVAGPLNNERQQAGLLRIIKQLQRLRAAPELEVLLEQLLAHPAHNPARVEAALTGVEALRVSAQRLSDHQRLSRVLWQWLPSLKAAGVGLYDKRFVTALLRCAEFDLLHELLPLFLSKLDDNSTRTTLISVLEQLFRYDVLGDARHYIERVYLKDPGDPMAAMVLGRLLYQEGQSSMEIAPLFEAVRADTPGHDEAVLWLAQIFFWGREHEQLTRWFDAHPLNDTDKARSAQALLNRVRAMIDRHLFPDTVSEAESERLNLQTLGPLAQVLKPLVQALNGDLSHSAHSSVADMCSDLLEVARAVDKATESVSDLHPLDCLRTARALVRAAKVHLRNMVIQYRSMPNILGPQYGVLDATRMMELFEGMHRVAMRLSCYGIEAALRDAPLADVRYLCQLVDIHMQSAFELGAVQSSEALLQSLREGRVATMLTLRLLERCALQRGDLQAAAEFVAGQPGRSSEMLRLEPFSTWACVEELESEVLAIQEPLKGTFEYIDSQGHPHLAPHEVPATRVDLFKVHGLRVRDTELLIGPRGSIPRPHPWHFRDEYGYPRPSSIRINHGYRGCRLRPASEKLCVREPVVVLANMDGPYFRNYYHWMLLILTRVAVLLDRGVFESRRLLVPLELSNWMTASLELTGLPKERMLLYTAKQEVQVDDAWVIGSIEFAAAALIKPLQRRLWAMASVDLHSRGLRRAVWLSRRKQHWRCLANEDAIETMAQRMGFDVVVPESLSLLDQVRLCADAAVIVGPAGANLTNLMFARPGARVLGLLSESNNYPGFIDLCTAIDLPHRWLFGRADPRKTLGGPMHESFEVNMDVLERELRRLSQSAEGS